MDIKDKQEQDSKKKNYNSRIVICLGGAESFATHKRTHRPLPRHSSMARQNQKPQPTGHNCQGIKYGRPLFFSEGENMRNRISQRLGKRVACHQPVVHKTNRTNKTFKTGNKTRNSRLKLDSMSSDKLAFRNLLIAALYSS